STVRWGMADGVGFDSLNFARINELMIVTQPAHIQMMAERPLEAVERDEWRAQLIRKALSA
ncbi:MAG: ATP--guanido phosphotransferase, partial [Elusimicrobia bacterium]|nr:ATP--guanido phosphotransferase [Elusimicrobiota bacterium]